MTSPISAAAAPSEARGLSDEFGLRLAGWLGFALVLALVCGALAAVFWAGVVSLPTYQVEADGSAFTTERGLAAYFASDAWYCFAATVVGAGLGVVAWRWFRSLGWPVALIAGAVSLVAGLVCWQVGQLLGPGPFDERLAAAKPGDVVPIALELHATSAIALWPFVAVGAVLLFSSLGPDPDAPPRIPRRSRRAGQ